MMPHTRQEKPFSEKLKAFFRVGKTHGFPRHQEAELVLSSETLSELGQDQAMATRLRVVRELQGQVREKRLQEHGVELLWYKVEDLLNPSQERDTRHEVWAFLTELVLGQYNSLDMLRPQMFRFLRKHRVTEDLGQRVAILAALTDTGKEILHIEEQVGVFLLELLALVAAQEQGQGEARAKLLALASNMVRYNSAYLDQEVVVGLIESLAGVAVASREDGEILACLDILRSVVTYSYLPPEALVPFITCVCKVVNLPSLSTEAWDTTRKLLGTHLGHSALYNLCQIVQSPANHGDPALVRGAVFFIGRSLWGEHRIPSLRYSAMSVLPFLLSSLDCPHQGVMFEVSVQLQELVVSQGETLTAPEWEETVNVLECLVSRLERCTDKREAVHQHLKTTIGQLEALAMTDRYSGSRSRLYGLVEKVAHLCPEASVLHLLAYMQSTVLHPARGGWVERLAGLVDTFYCRDGRRGVRLRALQVLGEVVTANLSLHGDRLLEVCVLPHLARVEEEEDHLVRVEAVQVVSQLASQATGPKLLELVDILETCCKRFDEPLRGLAADTMMVFTREDFDYQRAAVLGVVRCLKVNFQRNGPLVRRCYYILVEVLEALYERPVLLEHTGEVRLEIFRSLLAMRANRNYQLGLPREEGEGSSSSLTSSSPSSLPGYSFSPGLVCERPQEGEAGLTLLSLTRACMAVIRCLKEEPDWRVLAHVLQQVPNTMQNKGMITRYGSQISHFATVLCSLFNTSHPLPTLNLPPKFSRPDFQAAVYPVLAALASYNKSLEAKLQKQLIQCFEFGLITSKCSQVCIVALTACILEMSGSMYALLPEVLLNLSKISATVHIAVPVLEFLSTLISLPQVFASFSPEQFLSVFAITLPYTNPFKFNHYTVSLAHHVIIMWFLKCRLANRKEFVKFIIKGLGSNVLQPFEEGNFRKEGEKKSLVNEDSSNRPRSSSLREAGPSRRERHMTGVPSSRPALQRVSAPDERQALLTFHQELTETCVDLMARYSFSNCGVQPRRGPVAEQLLSKGTSCSWLVGNIVVTITVSGCAQSSNRAGLCDCCWAVCQPPEEEQGKRRHQSEQSSRVRRAGGGEDKTPLQPLVREGGAPGEGEGAGGGRAREEGAVCGCWCSGWCEVMVRRPSGVTSWVARVQNGLLSNQPQLDSDGGLRDITDLLRPSLGREPGQPRTARVKRANSNPEIEVRDLVTRLELDLAHTCSPILEQEEEELGSSAFRGRSATVSTPQRPPRPPAQDRGERGGGGPAMSPQFMFLQLYQAAGLPLTGGEKPLLLPGTKNIENSLKILDRIYCTETHKVGVVYVGLGQEDDERAILANQFGSTRYSHFLSGLGTLVDITATDPKTLFMGGLDARDDGQFAYIWQDDAMQVVYHTATLMPNDCHDPQSNKKKRHIGNDYVAIVYNESGHPYTMGTVKGQFIYAVIVVEPLDFESNRMSVLTKPELEADLGHLATSRIVSDQNLARLTRQTALHCGLAAVILDKGKRTKVDPYASNWLERLRHIKRLKTKVLKEQQDEETSGQLHDFTGYV